MSDYRCYHCGHLLDDINAACPQCLPKFESMRVVGHPKVSYRAYGQKDMIERATRFAEATVHNGLSSGHDLTKPQIDRLKLQIERDFLVAMLDCPRPQ